MAGRGRTAPMLVFGVLVALVASLLVTPVASADPAGLELRSAQQLSPRLTQLRLYSPALAHDANVRVLTPDGFDPDRDHLPVLLLLHGGFGSSADWTTVGGLCARHRDSSSSDSDAFSARATRTCLLSVVLGPSCRRS